jgi:hypothetical protein
MHSTALSVSYVSNVKCVRMEYKALLLKCFKKWWFSIYLNFAPCKITCYYNSIDVDVVKSALTLQFIVRNKKMFNKAAWHVKS